MWHCYRRSMRLNSIIISGYACLSLTCLQRGMADDTDAKSKLGAEIAALKDKIENFSPSAESEIIAWEEKMRQPVEWKPLEITGFTATPVVGWEKLKDGSILVHGNVPATCAYLIKAQTPTRGITALRLEAIPDDSLPHRGPGLAGNGNAVVNEFRVDAFPATAAAPKARYIRLEAPGKQRTLHFAEMEVYSSTNNVARGGTASQSSTYKQGEAKLAIDGNTDGNYADRISTHTNPNDDAWWELDLGSDTAIDKIVLWNRTDGNFGNRLAPFQLVALDENRKPLWTNQWWGTPRPKYEVTVTNQSRSLVFKNPTATFSQKGWPVADAIDDALGTGWAFGGRAGQPHTAVFLLAEKIDFGQNDTHFQISIAQEFGVSHLLGRFRISATTAPLPVAAISEPLLAILNKDRAERSPSDTLALKELFRATDGTISALRDELTAKQKALDLLP